MSKRFLLLLFSFAMVFILPLIGSYLKWDGMPPGYGLFPAQKAVDDPGFNQTVFNICACIGLTFLLYLFFPKLFGFKKISLPAKTKKKAGYPKWFVPGIVVLVISWFFMWGRFGR